MRLHYRVSPRQQFHANSRTCLQHLPLFGRNQATIGFRGIIKIKNIGLVKTRQLAQRAHGCTHMGAFKCAKKPHRDAGSLRHASQRKLSILAQLTQTNADGAGRAIWRRAHETRLFEHLHNGGSVQASDLAQKSGALEQFHIGRSIETIFARGAPRAGESQLLPGADYRRRNANQASHVSDF